MGREWDMLTLFLYALMVADVAGIISLLLSVARSSARG